MSLNDTTQDAPVKLCECGCGQPTPLATITNKSNGRIMGQPTRFVHGHNRRRSAVNRFWENVNQNASNECWEWTGSKLSAGYGMLYIGNQMKLAHRYSYELHNGAIPQGMFCCHHCDNPSCVNPAHLFLGTHNDNMADMKSKGRQKHGNGKAKVTEAQVLEIRQKYARGGITHRELAAIYGVNREAISNIIQRKNWPHVP